MKAIILEAGYATRLYPLTENKPKGLLKLNGISLLDRLYKKLEEIPAIKDVVIVTNNKFYKNFENWRKKYEGRLSTVVINDNTYSNEDRLGAIGDTMLVLETCGANDDIMLLCGDMYFEDDLKGFYNFFKNKNADCVCGDTIDDHEYLKQFGVGELDKNGRLLNMEEKPKEPKGTTRILGFYIYKRETLKLFETYKQEGNNLDAPGRFLSWLYQRKPVYAYVFNNTCFDIGTPDVYYGLDAKLKAEAKKDGKITKVKPKE